MPTSPTHSLTAYLHTTPTLNADETTGEVHPGIIEIVTDLVESNEVPEPNTLGEMEQWGIVDPVPYEYGYNQDGTSEVVSIKDGNTFFDLIARINVDEEAVEKWFGAGRNHIRDRAIMLVENGHINPASIKVIRVQKTVARSGPTAEYLYLLEAKVVASQKGQWYLTRVGISEQMDVLLRRPYSSCECVVRRGPIDSHQLAVLLYILTLKIVMGRLEDRSWRQLKTHVPDHILIMQKVPVTVKYAYGPGSRQRYKGVSAGHIRALLKLRPPITAAVATTTSSATVTIAAPSGTAAATITTPAATAFCQH